MQRREFMGLTATLALLAASPNLNAEEKEKIMKLTQKAQKAFDELLGGQFPLAKSDPEFSEIYLNFLFDDVSENVSLAPSERALVSVACLVATGNSNALRRAILASLKCGVKPAQIKEIIYQATAYAGFAVTEKAFYISNEAFADAGVKLPLPSAKTTTRENREQKGLEIQRVYFPKIDAHNAAAPEDEKRFCRFLSANCFGDYYTREGLDLRTRELMTFVFIASLGLAQPQLKAHVAGNLQAGNDRAKLLDTVTAIAAFIGYPRTLNAIVAIDEVAQN